MKLLTKKQKKIKEYNEKCDSMTEFLVNSLILLLFLLILLNLMVII